MTVMETSFHKSVVCPVLIDRVSELATLNALIDLANSGRGQVVLLSGEAGIGKSRLVARDLLRLSCIIRPEGITTMETRDALRSQPAHPWVEEHRNRVGYGLQVFPIDTKTEPGRNMLAAGQLAEKLGFDAFFTAEHPSWGLEGWKPLAAIAVKTEHIRLGSNVNCIFYRHPVMLAHLAADLDQLSQDRLILGLGCGWDANEFTNFGLSFPQVRERQEALEEAITIIRGVWGAEPF
jgi:hypothetical protein